MNTLTVLGIESSCDETAVAVVRAGADLSSPHIVSQAVLSQLDDHRPYGGVVPEIAARAHLLHMDAMVDRVMNEAGISYADLSAIAATSGPGLIGGVIIGMMTGKALTLTHNKPFIGVNHLEGHALSVRLVSEVRFPFLLLLISGGHCQLLIVHGVGSYRRLGTTLDDAVGEAFDKTAKLLGLGYPGGPAVERASREGDPNRFALPLPLVGKPGCDFSFSGLKTAVRHTFEGLTLPSMADQNDMAASFQKTVVEILVDRSGNAMDAFNRQVRSSGETQPAFVVAGGVAANQAIRSRLMELSTQRGFAFVAPPLSLCTDNAAMIAWAGLEKLSQHETDSLSLAPKARWPLDESA